MGIIYLSRIDDDFGKAASNAIGILNYSRFSLNDKNFDHVKIPDANL
jgi:hypothetical protein